MKDKKIFLFIFLLFFSLAFEVNAATFSYYFSNAGSDSAGTGTQVSPWATLSKAQSAVNSHTSSDTVFIYFARGSKWSANTAAVKATAVFGLSIGANSPIVNIDAYGTGSKPIFDGQVTDFSSVPVHNATSGPFRWSRWFEIRRTNCSIKNVEIRNTYGSGVYLDYYSGNGDYLTLSNLLIHNFGDAGIGTTHGAQNVVVEYSTFHTGQQLFRFSKVNGWGGAITLSKASGTRASKDNHVHHNIIYDIMGEGIIVGNSTTEFNVIGDTCSTGIMAGTHNYDGFTANTRYNFLIQSSYSTSAYTYCPYWEGNGVPVGIRIYDDAVGGNNATANYSVYGNIMINRAVGFWFFSPEDLNNPYGTVKIYNNTVIDSRDANYRFLHANQAKNAYIYNNSSILYDRTTGVHVQDDGTFPAADWRISNNHFWTTGGAPVVDSNWRTNYVVGDPKLPGEPSINWIGQSGSSYFMNIELTRDLYPASDSPLFGRGMRLDSSFSNIYLTTGSKFDLSPAKAILLTTTITANTPWHLGAFAPSASSAISPIPPPSGVTIDIK